MLPGLVWALGLIVFPGHHGATSFSLSYKSILGTRKEMVSARTLWLFGEAEERVAGSSKPEPITANE